MYQFPSLFVDSFHSKPIHQITQIMFVLWGVDYEGSSLRTLL